MTKRLIALSCCRRHLSHLQLSCSLPSHSLFVFLSAFVWTIRFTLSQLTEELLWDWRRRTDVCVWVDSSSVASIAECLQYGERRRVLMHAWLNSVHGDATWKVCEVYASVSLSQSEVRGDGLTISLWCTRRTMQNIKLILNFQRDFYEKKNVAPFSSGFLFTISSHTVAEHL